MRLSHSRQKEEVDTRKGGILRNKNKTKPELELQHATEMSQKNKQTCRFHNF